MAGHEICGKVLSLGSKVPDDKGPRVGDVVVVYPWPGCGQCETCSAENWQLCDEHGSTSVCDVDAASPVPPSHVGQDNNPSLASFQVSTFCSLHSDIMGRSRGGDLGYVATVLSLRLKNSAFLT